MTLGALCDEVKDVTNFKPFVMFGGPNPSGTGSIQIFQCVSRLSLSMPTYLPPRVGTGETIMTGQTFQQYMGLLWNVVKDKYWQWLNATYSKSLSKFCFYS